MPRGGAAAADQPDLSKEQAAQVEAFAQTMLAVESQMQLLEAIGLFQPTFLLLKAASPEREQLQGALRVMAFKMDDMALSEDTLAKAKRLFVGNAELLPDCILRWQRARDAKEHAAEPQVQAAANTPKPTRVEAMLHAAIAAGFLETGSTEGKLKEASKRMESSGAPSFSLRATVRFATGSWLSEPKTPGLPGSKEHGFLRAAWRDARQSYPTMEPSQVLLMVWSATRHFMVEVCREDLATEMAHCLWVVERKLLHPLAALDVDPDRIIDAVEKHCFESMHVLLAQHRDKTEDEQLPAFDEMLDLDVSAMEQEVTRHARDARRAGAAASMDDAEFAVLKAASGLMMPFSIPPATASLLRQDNVCPLDLVAAKLCPMGVSCAFGHFATPAAREDAVSDTRYGLTTAVRALRARLYGVGTQMAAGDVYASTPRPRAYSPKQPHDKKKGTGGGSYAAAAATGGKKANTPKRA